MKGTSGKLVRHIAIFIGSPGDVNAERKSFPRILEKVNRLKARAKDIVLDPVGWEGTLPGVGPPQKKINEDLRQCDLIVLVLGKRWGTPTGKYSSGFEEEYRLARRLHKEIWLYLRSIPDNMLADPGDQLKKVIQFRNTVEAERKLLFRRYQDERAWEEKLTDDLCRWLDGQQPGTSEIESTIAQYAGRVGQLEHQLAEMTSKQARTGTSLVEEARQLADSGHLTLAEQHFAEAIALSPLPSSINEYGLFLLRVGELQKAMAQFSQLADTARSRRDRALLAVAQGNLGVLYQTRGDLAKAEEMHRKALAIDEQLGSKEGMAADYGNLGILRKTRGDLATAEEMYRKSLAIEQELGRKEGMAADYGNLGILYKTRGDLATAEEMYRKALAINEELGSKEGMAKGYGNLGILYQTRGDLATAEEMYRKSLAIEQELGRKEGIATDYGNLGNLYQVRGDLATAEEMYRKALALFTAVGAADRVAWARARLQGLGEPTDGPPHPTS